MKTPSDFAALTALTHRDFKSKVVITPLRRFELYDDGKQCNVHNWSSEYQAHIYHRLDVAVVDGKPLYFVQMHSEQGDWLCGQSYRSITEVKKAWYGLL